MLPLTVTSLVASNATYARAAGLPLRIRLADFTWDTGGAPIILVSVGPSLRGATLTTNRTHILYQPSADLPDEFPYTVRTDTATNSGRIFVTVTNVAGGIAREITYAGGVVTIKFFGIPGQRYQVQRATSLTEPVAWVPLTQSPLTPGPDGAFSFTDTNAPQPGPAYYRSVQYAPGG